MSKFNKTLLVKLVGGTTAAAPAVGGTIYAVIAQREYDGLQTKIELLETKNKDQERTITEQSGQITELSKKPENVDREKDRKEVEDAKKEIADEKAKVQKLTEENNQLKQNKEDSDGLKTSVAQLTSKVEELAGKLKTAENKVKEYDDAEKDIWAPTKKLLKSVVTWMRITRKYTSKDGYDNYGVGAGTIYGGGVPDVVWFCKTENGGLTIAVAGDCKETMNLKKMEEWTKEPS